MVVSWSGIVDWRGLVRGKTAYVFGTGGVAGWVPFSETGGLVHEDGTCVFVGSTCGGQLHCDFDVVAVVGGWHGQSQREEDEGLSEFHVLL